MGVLVRARAGAVVTDRIVLTMPADAGFRSVGTLVLGGIGSRVDVPYERMDDLQLAVVSALDAASDGEVTLEVDVSAGGLRVALGPLRDGSSHDDGLGLVLSRLVDDVEHEHRDGKEWICLVLVAGRDAAG